MFLFMFIIGGTGGLLGWKKQMELRPGTQKGISTKAEEWLPLEQIHRAATAAADSLHWNNHIDRIDVRPGKGIAKIIFDKHYSELQIDLTNGKVLSTGKRYSDLIEHIHDGTIIDRLIGSKEQVKTIYTTLTSIGLMLLSFSGFWLWLNPKRMRRIKNQSLRV